VITVIVSGKPNPPAQVETICLADEQAVLAHVPEADVLTWPWIEALALDRDIDAAEALLSSVFGAVEPA
jgi:hypothetical protein